MITFRGWELVALLVTWTAVHADALESQDCAADDGGGEYKSHRRPGADFPADFDKDEDFRRGNDQKE